MARMKKLNSLRLCSCWCQFVWPRQPPTPLENTFRPKQRKRNEGHLKNSWHPVENDSTPNTSQRSPLFPPFPTAPAPRPQLSMNTGLLFLFLFFFPSLLHSERIASIAVWRTFRNTSSDVMRNLVLETFQLRNTPIFNVVPFVETFSIYYTYECNLKNINIRSIVKSLLSSWRCKQYCSISEI